MPRDNTCLLTNKSFKYVASINKRYTPLSKMTVGLRYFRTVLWKAKLAICREWRFWPTLVITVVFLMNVCINIQNPLKSEYGHVWVKQQLFLFLMLQDGLLIWKTNCTANSQRSMIYAYTILSCSISWLFLLHFSSSYNM